MTERYKFDPTHSRFTARAFASGLLSALAHSPTFAVRDFGGEIRFEGGQVDGLGLDLTVRAGSLDLIDKVSDSDHREIEERMMRDVLDVASFPEIAFQAVNVPAEMIAQGNFRLRIDGRLTIHGVTRPRRIDAGLRIFQDGILLSGECPVRLSDHRIAPVTALGGAIALKDELHLEFELFAPLEGP